MIAKTKIFFYVLLTHAFVPHFFAQTHAVKWYNTEQGLPQNSVKDIVKDKYGFLWLATENGLCRYDGSVFLNFENIVLNNKRLGGIYGSVSGDRLVTDNENYEEQLIIKNRQVQKRVQPSAKNSDFRKEAYEIFNSYIIKTLHFHRNLYFHTKEGNFYIKDYRSWLKKYSKEDAIFVYEKIRTYAKVIDGYLFYMDKKTEKVVLVTKNANLDVEADPVFFDKKSRVFWNNVTKQSFMILGTDIFEVRFANNRLVKNLLFSLDDLPTSTILSLYYDADYEKLYLGSSTKGLGIVTRKKFKAVKSIGEPLDAIFYAHIPVDSSTVITPDGQLLQSTGVFKNYNFSKYKDFDTRCNITAVRNDSYWILNRLMLYQYKLSTQKAPILVDSIFTEKKFTKLFDLNTHFAASVQSITPDPVTLNVKKWLYFYKGTSFKTPSEVIEFPRHPSTILELSNHKYLVGTFKGLYLLDRHTKKNELIAGTKNLKIRNIKKTDGGAIFLLTNGQGFYVYKDKKVLKMPVDVKKALLNPHCILEDKTHNLWISTNNGLFKVPESELIANTENNKKPVNYYKYTSKDGFNVNEFNGGCNPSGNKLDNGEFTFSSMDGIVFFKPEEVKSYFPKNGLQVERCKIDGKNTLLFKYILPLKNNFFRAVIYPDVPFYGDYQNLVVEAFLEGKSTNWERIDVNDGYNISQLNHGSYTLTFRVLTSPKAAYIYKTISIQVAPLFYQTLYFKLFIFLIFLLSLILFYKARTRYLVNINKKLNFLVDEKTNSLRESLTKIEEVKNQLNKETRMQKKLLGTISHDIATPLKYINIIATKLSKLSDKEIEKSRDLLLSMQHSSAELFMFTNTLQSYANLYNENQEKAFENFDLHDLIKEKIALFNEFARSKSIVITNLIPDGAIIKSNRNVIQMAMHNIIDNAVKYTETGSISITFEKTAHNFTLKISDTGTGMDANVIKYYDTLQTTDDPDKLSLQKFGVGLHMVIQLLPIVKGKLSFLNNQPKGTIVQLEILL